MLRGFGYLFAYEIRSLTAHFPSIIDTFFQRYFVFLAQRYDNPKALLVCCKLDMFHCQRSAIRRNKELALAQLKLNE